MDSSTSDEIMSFLQKLNHEKGITLIMVTHENDVAAYASRRIQMRDGKIINDEIITPNVVSN